MKKDYLSREEDELFSRTVLDFNNSSQTNEKEKNAIRERTKILIYIVARDMLHLSYDDASTVFLDMEKELDKIITSYRVSNATFNQYLRQLCQYRCRRIKQKTYQNNLWENAFFMEEAAYNSKHPGDYDVLDACTREHRSTETYNQDLYSEYGLKEIIDFITKTRKRFLIFLLTLPRKTESIDSYDIARVLQVDECAINRLLYLKDEALGYQEEKIREIQSRASKHWRIMAKLVANINKENDEDKKRKLRDHYQTQVICHRKNVSEIRKVSNGMSRTYISNILGLSRSSVSVAVKETSTLLEMIAKS